MSKTVEAILDYIQAVKLINEDTGGEQLATIGHEKAVEAINQLLIEAKIEGRKIQAEATLDKWESGANEGDMTLFLNAQVEAHRYELQQSLKENSNE